MVDLPTFYHRNSPNVRQFFPTHFFMVFGSSLPPGVDWRLALELVSCHQGGPFAWRSAAWGETGETF